MKITLGFSLQTCQFVKNARLLFWCQTLKLGPLCTRGDTSSRKSYKEQKRSIFLSHLWNVFRTFIPDVSVQGPGPSPHVRSSWNMTKKKLHECSQDELNRHGTAFRCGSCSPLLLGQEKEKRPQTFCQLWSELDHSWSNFNVAFIFFYYIQKIIKQYNNQIQLLLCLTRQNEAIK